MSKKLTGRAEVQLSLGMGYEVRAVGHQAYEVWLGDNYICMLSFVQAPDGRRWIATHNMIPALQKDYIHQTPAAAVRHYRSMKGS